MKYEQSFLKSISNNNLTEISYTGPSMNPTFKVPDILLVEKCNYHDIKIGDILVFLPKGKDRNVTHRVISITNEGIKTQGDNNLRADDWILREEDVIGRVAYAERLRHRHRIRRRMRGGEAGKVLGCVLRIKKYIWQMIVNIIRPFYLLAAKINFIRIKNIKIIKYTRGNGIELQMVWRNKVIGIKRPGRCKWQIKVPYRLFVNGET